MRFSDSKNLCISFGGTLAIPMNEEEDEAAKSFLSDHFSGDLNAVASGLGVFSVLYRASIFAIF
jgi:hypothetical protein